MCDPYRVTSLTKTLGFTRTSVQNLTFKGHLNSGERFPTVDTPDRVPKIGEDREVIGQDGLDVRPTFLVVTITLLSLLFKEVEVRRFDSPWSWGQGVEDSRSSTCWATERSTVGEEFRGVYILELSSRKRGHGVRGTGWIYL